MLSIASFTGHLLSHGVDADITQELMLALESSALPATA